MAKMALTTVHLTMHRNDPKLTQTVVHTEILITALHTENHTQTPSFLSVI